MLIKIIKSEKLAIDCRTTISFEEGEIKDNLDDKVAIRLMELGIAIKFKAKEEKALPKLQNKAITNLKNKNKK